MPPPSSSSSSVITKVSRILWQQHYDIALASLSHPFVLSLQRGHLNSEAVKRYIAQDAYYLNSFKSAFGSAKKLCISKKDIAGTSAFQSLQDNVLEELELHKELSHSLGIDLNAVSPMPATELYVNFLHESTLSNSLSKICAAMVPCMSLYAFIGKRATTNGLCTNTSTNRWVQEYSSPEFQSYALQLETMLDDYAVEEKASSEDLSLYYQTAMELEYSFFNAFEFPSWSGVRAGAVMVDFDETMSLDDSIELICCAQASHNEEQSLLARQTYEKLLEDYLSQRKAFLSTILPTSAVPYNRSTIDELLHKLTIFETSMLGAVEQSGILKGCTRSDLLTAGRGLHIRNKCFEVLSFASRSLPCPSDLHIVTLNWSRDVVLGACESHLPQGFFLHSNDLEWTEGGESAGGIVKHMTGPVHKVPPVKSATASCSDCVSIFIGDSVGDLAAMLEVDIPVLIASKGGSTINILRLLGFEIRPIEVFVSRMTDKESPLLRDRAESPAVIYTADSWAHIGFCLFGKPLVSSVLSRLKHTSSSSSSSSSYSLPSVLTIAGSDSGGGAGIQADIKTCAANGVFASSVITALTAQNTVGVSLVENTSPAMLSAQLEAVLSDITVNAVKTGMVPSEAAARLIASALIKHAVEAIVIDPVMITSSGNRLMPAEEAEGIRRILFPMATIITPNIHETCSLLGIPSIKNIEEMEAAAIKLFEYGSSYVLVKGGHLIEGQQEGQVVDVLYNGHRFEHINGDFVDTSNTHGTGCTLASAIAAELAKGKSVPVAVREAKQYLLSVLRLSADIKLGVGPHGPLHHTAAVVPRQRMCRNNIDLSLYAVTDA